MFDYAVCDVYDIVIKQLKQESFLFFIIV